VKATTSNLDLENKLAILFPTSHQYTNGSAFSTKDTIFVLFMYLDFTAPQVNIIAFRIIETSDMIFIVLLESIRPNQLTFTGIFPRMLAE